MVQVSSVITKNILSNVNLKIPRIQHFIVFSYVSETHRILGTRFKTEIKPKQIS